MRHLVVFFQARSLRTMHSDINLYVYASRVIVVAQNSRLRINDVCDSYVRCQVAHLNHIGQARSVLGVL